MQLLVIIKKALFNPLLVQIPQFGLYINKLIYSVKITHKVCQFHSSPTRFPLECQHRLAVNDLQRASDWLTGFSFLCCRRSCLPSLTMATEQHPTVMSQYLAGGLFGRGSGFCSQWDQAGIAFALIAKIDL